MGRLHQTALCRSAGRPGVLMCRYTHRVAITNSRLETLDLQNGTVTFRYKDYAHQSQIRTMTFPLAEFSAPLLPSHLAAALRENPPLRPALQPRSLRPNRSSPRAPGPGSFSPRGGQGTRPDYKACGSASAGLSQLRTALSGPDPHHPPP
jgi:hypothetical protein